MENKKLTRATILIATFLIAIPIMPTWATTAPAAVSLVPNPSSPDLGDSFILGVTPSAGFGVVGYDIAVNFDPSVFTATAVSSGTLPASGGVFIIRTDILNALGIVRQASVVLGGGCWSTDGTNSFYGINFQANSPGPSASAYPSAITVTVTSRLVGDSGTCGIDPLGFTATPFSYMPPASPGGTLALQSVGCRAVNDGFNTLSKGNSDPLFCRVVNTGTKTVTASTSYSFRSVGGVTGSVTGSSMSLAPGQFAQLTGANLVVPSTNDIYIITGTPTRLITMGDGSVLTVLSDQSDNFKVVVNT